MKGDNWTIESLLRPHMKLIAAIVVLQILGAIAQVVSITLLKPIMNKGIYSDDMSEFIFLACALVTATLIVAAVLIVTTIMASHVATSVAEGLRVSIMNATVGVDDLGKLGSSPTDAMVCLTNDVASVQRYVFEGLRTYLPMPVLLLLLLYYTFSTNVIIGVIMLITILIISITTTLFTRRLRPLYVEQVKCLGEINTSLREKILGARTIRAYNGYDYEVDKFYERSGRYGGVNKEIALNSYYIPNMATACMWIFIVFIFVASALEEGTSLNASEIIIFMQFATTIVSTLALVSYISIGAPRARVCFLHINDMVMKAKEENRNHDYTFEVENTANSIQAEKVVLTDRFGSMVLDNFDLRILRGRTVTILGPNGEGSSHLMDMILGFEKPDSGRFVVNGMDISRTDPRDIRPGVAYAGNSTHILSGTLRFNLDPHGRYSDEELIAMCDRVGLTEFISSQPEGLDTSINHAEASMSGGQRLLVIIARCLIKDADLYVFDDCLFSLDNVTKQRVLDAISEVCAGKTVIFRMHDTSTCELSDEIILMFRGRIVGQGKHSELLESSELYNELYKTGQGRHGTWA